MQTQSDEMESRLSWRPKSVARALDISERQVYRLEEQGRLKSVKLGRIKLFTDASVRELLTSAA